VVKQAGVWFNDLLSMLLFDQLFQGISGTVEKCCPKRNKDFSYSIYDVA